MPLTNDELDRIDAMLPDGVVIDRPYQHYIAPEVVREMLETLEMVLNVAVLDRSLQSKVQVAIAKAKEYRCDLQVEGTAMFSMPKGMRRRFFTIPQFINNSCCAMCAAERATQWRSE